MSYNYKHNKKYFQSALDFDHVRWVKKFSIAISKIRSWDSLLSEIEKCEVVCANCHRIRTTERIKNAKL